ncbi:MULTISPECIES: branched-chain amino acid aminotransferase [unclassified Janthinobacterium]|uniref:branched-chain amino acid aminotransferase n=1 Tax=unclassified Janthinobacterium TaxID=2610881 RepID=UPI0008F4B400|nr:MULTISPECIES: branched-chain amino acid aminotransferase [unclassified Janthinobacterium]APA69007.1 branched-chain amino acid aminotransferase [Janthinobacterium sp. 1_2014MBL_MicDiv]MDN2712102.1 branched-chain amino acid aminotransferase [Janthinobacterium sp. SUN118]
MTTSTPNLVVTPSAHPLSDAERAARMVNPAFGRIFTDHMVVIPYRDGKWQQGELKAYGPLMLDPSASSLHYGQAIFEGYKAFAQPDGSIKTFRPEQNAERFNRSAARLAMPAIPVELFLEAGDALIAQDRNWVPKNTGESLYMRPLMIATDPYLGVRPSEEYLFVLFASPAGAYFPKGVKPVTVWISEDFVRAAPGGTGEAKCAGNYAASLMAQSQAQEKGCDQVVWLDAVHREYIEEMGGMNLFFVYKDGEKVTVVTPELTGTLLPGITRRSLLEMAKDLGYATEERKLSVQQWRDDIASGRMTEVFACGTAAVITPVGVAKANGFEMTINNNENGAVTLALREALLGLQHGTAPDTHNWMHTVC